MEYSPKTIALLAALLGTGLVLGTAYSRWKRNADLDAAVAGVINENPDLF